MAETGGAGCSYVFTTLGIVFVVLKLTNVIDWEWWLVLLPLWGPTAVAILLYGAFCIYKALRNRFKADRW